MVVMASAVRESPLQHPLHRRRLRRRERAALVIAFVGVLAVLRHTGLWVGDWLIWPLGLGVVGMGLVWRPAVAHRGGALGEGVLGGGSLDGGSFDGRLSDRRLSFGEYLRTREGRLDLPRLAIGVLLVLFASAALLHAARVLHNLGDAIGAAAIVATAVGLLVAPWFVRLGQTLATERSARIREQERAEVAAHLHDSVLQTLALIQKRAGDPREVASLARRQERELRRWLFERPSASGQASVRTALERAAAEVEELHGVPIEVVIVGDRTLEARLEALVPAAREALTNAAKFAGSDHVDLFAEVGEDRVEVFVRDRGVGFDTEAIPADRRGVRDSILGRVERRGGRAWVRSTPGEGTEVELVMDGAGG